MPALDDIPAIPGNRPVYQRLRKLLEDRKGSAFVGAGIPFPLYPLWDGLLQSLAHAPVERGLATTADEECWLVRDNFKAWITTNYDQGLVEARRVRRRRSARPASPSGIRPWRLNGG